MPVPNAQVVSPELISFALAMLVVMWFAWRAQRNQKNKEENQAPRPVVEEVRRDQVSFMKRAEETMLKISDRMKDKLRRKGVPEADLEFLIIQQLEIKGDRLIVTFSVPPPYHRYVPDETYTVVGGQWSDLRDSYDDPNQWLNTGLFQERPKGWGNPDEWDTSRWADPWGLKDSGGVIDPDETDGDEDNDD
jgi:hypothetical protein